MFIFSFFQFIFYFILFNMRTEELMNINMKLE